MIDERDWLARCRAGTPLGGCRCGGSLRPISEDDGTGRTHLVPFVEDWRGVRFYQAECDGCHVYVAYPNGRTSEDGKVDDEARRVVAEERRGRAEMRRIAALMPSREVNP